MMACWIEATVLYCVSEKTTLAFVSNRTAPKRTAFGPMLKRATKLPRNERREFQSFVAMLELSSRRKTMSSELLHVDPD